MTAANELRALDSLLACIDDARDSLPALLRAASSAAASAPAASSSEGTTDHLGLYRAKHAHLLASNAALRGMLTAHAGLLAGSTPTSLDATDLARARQQRPARAQQALFAGSEAERLAIEERWGYVAEDKACDGQDALNPVLEDEDAVRALLAKDYKLKDVRVERVSSPDAPAGAPTPPLEIRIRVSKLLRAVFRLDDHWGTDRVVCFSLKDQVCLTQVFSVYSDRDGFMDLAEGGRRERAVRLWRVPDAEQTSD